MCFLRVIVMGWNEFFFYSVVSCSLVFLRKGLKGKMVMRKGARVLMVVIGMVMEDVWAGVYKAGTTFNEKEHHSLCAVFQASAELWEASEKSDKVPNEDLKAGLRHALFGNTNKNNLNGITDRLPKVYQRPGHRGWRCGSCQNDDPYFPGSSITHDLMCLCTPGYYGEPYYAWFGWSYWENGFTLCGKPRVDMIDNGYHGWYAYKSYRVFKGLNKPWKTAVWGCLKSRKSNAEHGSRNLTEKIDRLKVTMQNFTSTLKKVGGHDKLGGFEEHNEADGSDERHIHVRYGTCKYGRRPWWKKLKETLDGKKPEDLLVSRPTNEPARRPGENPEDDLGEELSEEMEENEEDTEAEGHNITEDTAAQDANGTHTQGLTDSTDSTVLPHDTEETESSTYPQFQYLRSNTPKTLPCSWPLGVSFFI
ncbi:Variant surface glycoprotein [Trypanosoma congolense IL3000]|uniref:Variant surface glycoprotein n=1 Tax=Trypanosoma congolense (strain IL3000) TaxID=1068625 RepID=F9WG93_TRYCI|nr:Variant surface glycoprotein [Trypanosoma congolense IL3000]